MTDVITFSRPYAEAAYKVAVNDNTIDIWLQDMNILGKAVKDSRVKALLASPKTVSYTHLTLPTKAKV